MRKCLCFTLSVLCLALVHTRAKAGPKATPDRPISAVLVHKTAADAARRTAQTSDQTPQGPATEIDFTWSYAPNLPACAATQKSCYDGFTLTYATANIVIATQSTLDPAARSYNWVPKNGVPYGSLNFQLVANGYDEFGNSVASSPAETVVRNDVTSLAAPTVLPGLSGVPIP